MVLVGLIVRSLYVLVVLRDVPPGLDAVWYTLQGGSIRAGTGYVVPSSLFSPPEVATAAFPPIYPLYQAAWQSMFGNGTESVRLAGLVPASVTIVVTALLGRRISGSRVGLLAGALVAIDPVLVAVDGSSMSENVSVPLVTLAVLLALPVLNRYGRPGRVAVLGIVMGVGALTRQDLILLVPILLVAPMLIAGDRAWRNRIGLVLLGIGAACLLVVPWSIRNHRQLGTYATSTLSATSALAGANCDPTYSGRSIGSWEFSCVAAVRDPSLGEAGQAGLYQRTAREYARHHVGRLPAVVAAREARVWGYWDPRDQVPREAEESRRYGWQLAAWPFRVLLVATGAYGLGTMMRGHIRLRWPLLVPVFVAGASAAMGHGNPRFSAIAHPVPAVGLAGLILKTGSLFGSRADEAGFRVWPHWS